MRGALLLALALGLALPAQAAEPVRVEIVEFGIYTAEVTGQLREPNGVISNVVENICHIATTADIGLQPGRHFGFRYRVDGPPVGQTVELTLTVVFPPNPQATRHERHTSRVSGTVSYTGYRFDHEWEFLPGRWTLQVLDGSRVVAEQAFTVTKDGEPDRPYPDAANCFQVSSVNWRSSWRST